MSVRKRGEVHKPSNGSIKHTSQPVDTKTDHTRWRLKDDRGRHTWHYLDSDEELKAWPMTIADKYFLGLDTVSTSRKLKLQHSTPIDAHANMNEGFTAASPGQNTSGSM